MNRLKSPHGGDIYSQEDQGLYLTDYSANINPLGLPQGVKDALMEGMDFYSNYPDPYCRKLTKAVAEDMDVSREHLIFGNGASDIIFRLVSVKKPKQALIPIPTFAEYEKALTLKGSLCKFHRLRVEDDFRLEQDFLETLTEDTDMVFLCNPNNPTGIPIDNGFLREIVAICGDRDIFLVLDECFLSMTRERSMLPLVKGNKGIFILRAFTKDYAMAGIRLGYGVSGDEELLEALWEEGQPWNVSQPAQIAGAQAVTEKEYLMVSKAVIEKERNYLSRCIADMGHKVYPAAANYIFFKISENPNGFHRYMKEAGFLLRDCGNYRGLSPDMGYFRIAVRLRKDNERLIEALRLWKKVKETEVQL